MNSSKQAFRIALIFPPAMYPVSPPLGIASLKAYLDQAPVLVRNFDLNLAYFEQTFQWLENGRLRMSIMKMDHETTARKAIEARDFFRGVEGAGYFFDPALYNEHARVYTGFGSVLNGLFDNFARKILLGLPVPALVREFFGKLLEPVKSFKPDLVGFSILFSQQLFLSLALAKSFKEIGTTTVFGGATFSVMPDPGRLLSRAVQVSAGKARNELYPGSLIDYMIVGEGETGLASLSRGLAEGNGSLSSTPGLIWMRDGELARNAPEAVSDLNRLPLPDFSDFPLAGYHSPRPVLPYLAARGCPWRRCAFCTHQKTYLHYREEEADHTADRLAALARTYDVSHFCLVDEMVLPHRLDRIASNLIEGGMGIYFSAYAKPAGFTSELLNRSYASGLRLLMWGVESGSQRVLDLMRKGTETETAGSLLASAHAAGIWNLIFIIFGFPTETNSEWQSTLGFLERHGAHIDALSKSRFVLLEGSNVFLKPGRYRITRILDRPQRDPVSIAYDYEVAEGLTQAEATAEFEKTLPRLSTIGRSPWFGQFREHMLLYASRG
ncbi:MAG: radical SAM protein [Syntrophobacteraceae bacterium]